MPTSMATTLAKVSYRDPKGSHNLVLAAILVVMEKSSITTNIAAYALRQLSQWQRKWEHNGGYESAND